MNYTIGIILGIIILIVGAWTIIGSRKKKWYKVYMANNDVRLLCRDLNERWWRTSDRYLRFKDEHGREITFPSNGHWVLMWEEIPDELIEFTKEEIKRIKESLASKDN